MATVFALSQSATLYMQQDGWIHLRSFGNRDRLYLNFRHVKSQDRKTWEYSNFVFKTVEIKFVCKNHALQFSIKFSIPSDNISHDRRIFFQIELLVLPE